MNQSPDHCACARGLAHWLAGRSAPFDFDPSAYRFGRGTNVRVAAVAWATRAIGCVRDPNSAEARYQLVRALQDRWARISQRTSALAKAGIE